MNKKTDSWLKFGVVKAVVNNLKKEGKHPKELAYLESVENVDRAYVIANRYARNYIHLKDIKKKEDFLGFAKQLGIKWINNGNKWLDEDDLIVEFKNDNKMNDLEVLEVVNESNDEFIYAIQMADNSLNKSGSIEKKENIEEKQKALNGVKIISMIIENNVLQLNKGFFNKLNVNGELIGKYKDNDLYFCEDLNCLVGII